MSRLVLAPTIRLIVWRINVDINEKGGEKKGGKGFCANPGQEPYLGVLEPLYASGVGKGER